VALKGSILTLQITRLLENSFESLDRHDDSVIEGFSVELELLIFSSKDRNISNF
jgi:hypothetical protein